jgi:hypothetical protein
MTATAASYAPTKTEEGSQLTLSQVMHTRQKKKKKKKKKLM